MLPQLVIHAHEAVTRDHAHGDLVRESLGLDIRRMREHPDVPELVSHGGIKLVIIQAFKKPVLNRESKRLAPINGRFDEGDECHLRLNGHIDALRNTESPAQSIHDELNSIDHDGGGICSRYSNRTAETHGDDA